MWFVNEYKKVMAFFNFGSRSDLSSPFTEEQARLLTWTKVLEEEALKRQKITISELKEVTARCAREVGEQADFKKLLLTRAEGVLELLRSKSAVPSKRPQGIPYLVIGSALGVLAFIGGVLTNEFSVTGNRINLLSPPLCLEHPCLLLDCGSSFIQPREVSGRLHSPFLCRIAFKTSDSRKPRPRGTG